MGRFRVWLDLLAPPIAPKFHPEGKQPLLTVGVWVILHHHVVATWWCMLSVTLVQNKGACSQFV